MLKVKDGAAQGGPAAAAVGARPGHFFPFWVAPAACVSFSAQDIFSHAAL